MHLMIERFIFMYSDALFLNLCSKRLKDLDQSNITTDKLTTAPKIFFCLTSHLMKFCRMIQNPLIFTQVLHIYYLCICRYGWGFSLVVRCCVSSYVLAYRRWWQCREELFIGWLLAQETSTLGVSRKKCLDFEIFQEKYFITDSLSQNKVRY